MTATERLAEIKSRAEGATEEPWRWFNPEDDTPSSPEDFSRSLRTTWERPADNFPGITLPEFVLHSVDGDGVSESDAEFIAHARTDVPQLVAALEAVLEATSKRHGPEVSQQYETAMESIEDIINEALGVDRG